MVRTVSCGALLFDLDGVLIDSTPAVSRVWTNWALERGFDPDEVVHRAHGRPSITTVREYLPDADHQAENRKIERQEIQDLEGVIPLPGVLEFLESLPPDRWTIVTSCTRALAEVRICAAGLPLPTRFVTADEITRGKPDPEPYIRGSAMLGIAPPDCVVVEDVPAGIRAGKAAGMRVIGVETTLAGDALLSAGADFVVPGCSHIVNRTSSDGSLILELK
jgi:mannitol-1-/sugar-/sorbitol-6-phosphatase